MDRITIYSDHDYDENGNKIRLGWFDLDAAETVAVEGTYWDGDNHRGIVSGLQTSRAVLYRTKGGRWVEHCDGRNEFNGPDKWTFLTDDEAREWLIKAEDEDKLQQWFPDTPDESGPNLGGRPAVGPKVEVRLDPDVLAKVDSRATKEGVKRAEMLRRLIVAGL